MKRPVIERLMEKVRIDHDSGCWNFTGAKSEGYGSIGSEVRNKSVFTHRVTYEHFIGKIPDGLVIDHLCRNRSCCNPEHLEAVSFRTNLLRGESPMAKGHRKTHCINGHPLSGENLYMQGRRRSCRECRAARNKARYSKHAGQPAQV